MNNSDLKFSPRPKPRLAYGRGYNLVSSIFAVFSSVRTRLLGELQDYPGSEANRTRVEQLLIIFELYVPYLEPIVQHKFPMEELNFTEEELRGRDQAIQMVYLIIRQGFIIQDFLGSLRDEYGPGNNRFLADHFGMVVGRLPVYLNRTLHPDDERLTEEVVKYLDGIMDLLVASAVANRAFAHVFNILGVLIETETVNDAFLHWVIGGGGHTTIANLQTFKELLTKKEALKELHYTKISDNVYTVSYIVSELVALELTLEINEFLHPRINGKCLLES